MDNPGVYVSHVESSAWPLVYFFATFALGAALVIAVMLFTANRLRWFRPVSVVMAIAIAAGLVGTFQGMSSASSDYASREAAAYNDYVADVQQWLNDEYLIRADADTVKSLLTRQGENVVADNRVVPVRMIINYTADSLDVEVLNLPAIG
ncbi:MAG: hypothetical protein JWQ43_148 [Glaciihabitans sp.]|nr:hypothetical protein [Glaciihabitans sp.]